MPRYLIDANLPYYFGLWNNPDFLHIKDLNDSWSDDLIWQYALDNDLTILTKDSDFSLKVLYKGAPPKVVHFKFGNMRMNEFHDLISRIWSDIELLLLDNSLINIYLDKIESIK